MAQPDVAAVAKEMVDSSDAAALCKALDSLIRKKAVENPTSLRASLTKLAALCDQNNVKSTTPGEVIGEELLVLPELTCMQPRGRLRGLVGTKGLALTTSDGTTKAAIEWREVREVLAAPSCETETIEAQSLAATLIFILEVRCDLHSTAPTTKQMKDEYRDRCICFATGKKKEAAVEPPSIFFKAVGIEKKTSLSTSAALALAATKLADKPIRQILRGAPPAFHLISRATGAPFVKASLASSQGHLAFTQAGLLFLKPPIFLPVDKIASIQTGRAGGVSHASASFFDLDVEMESPFSAPDDQAHESSRASMPPKYEFGNIAKDELPEVEHFVKTVLLSSREGKLRDEDDDDEDDEDFDPHAACDDDAAADDGASNDDDDENEEDDDLTSDDGLLPGGLSVDDDQQYQQGGKKRRVH